MSNQTDLLLKDYKPETMLRRPQSVVDKPKFGVIDAHNHLFADSSPSSSCK